MRINQMITKGQFYQIFSTNSVRKFMENRLENLYGDIGASRVKLKSTINFAYPYKHRKIYHTLFWGKR